MPPDTVEDVGVGCICTDAVLVDTAKGVLIDDVDTLAADFDTTAGVVNDGNEVV